MFTGLPHCATARMKSVWRHKKAGVCSTSTDAEPRGDFFHGVHIGQYGHAEFAAHLGQNVQPLIHPEAAQAVAGGAVGLVKAALEQEGCPARCSFP